MSEENLPLVNVAVITYNQKEFLRECIESILMQDYSNLEIVIADDGSTDGTQDMLREYEQKYPDKFVLKLAEKNRGITANSNAAHFACTGKYIAWMGGDDLMLPQKISKQVAYMEANPDCTICYHDLEVFDSESNKILHYFSKRNKPHQGDVRTSIKYGAFNGACSVMVRAEKTPVRGFNLLLPVASD
ncbi:MAG: glycosyltransferase family 2 protein, partial [Halothiobacillus sp.]|nr:glycosyltransferase family 2 protein [Halothiobacillus sp.]